MFVFLVVNVIGNDVWVSPEGLESYEDYDYNVVWLNGSTHPLMFQSSVRAWTLTMYQFGSPKKSLITCGSTQLCN